MLASTNPVHSLTSLLGQNVFGKHTPVDGVPNLWAYEIETKETIERSKTEIREKIKWFLKFADISTKAEDFVESATMNPAFEESAMFENMIDLMFKDEYDVYVFDTAPTANARRLLGMSKVYSLWVDKMLKSREEAKTLREMLSFTKKKEQDPLMDYLLSFRDRMEHGRVLLTDPAKTSFFFVALPEALPIAVITRFIQWFEEFGIPVGGVVVNMLIERPRWAPTPPSSCTTASRCRTSTWGPSGRSSTAASAPSCRCSRPRSAACRCSSASPTRCSSDAPSAAGPPGCLQSANEDRFPPLVPSPSGGPPRRRRLGLAVPAALLALAPLPGAPRLPRPRGGGLASGGDRAAVRAHRRRDEPRPRRGDGARGSRRDSRVHGGDDDVVLREATRGAERRRARRPDPGDARRRRVPVVAEGMTVTEKVRPGEAPKPEAGSRLKPPAQPGDPVPPFSLVDQSGRQLTRDAYRGRILVVTFFFTRCPLPDYCPRMNGNLGRIEKVVSADAALAGKVRLLSVSFDTERDTPEVLRDYGLRYHDAAAGPPFAVWTFASGSADEVKKLTDFFGVWVEKKGESFDHGLVTSVVGTDGRVSGRSSAIPGGRRRCSQR